jgi:nucleotide-binding universal stress UspA family protein
MDSLRQCTHARTWRIVEDNVGKENAVNTIQEPRPVVVGVRGDQPALLGYALEWAELLHAPMRVVHAYTFPNYTSEPMTGHDTFAVCQDAAQAVLDAARRELGPTREVHVEFALLYGTSAHALESESKLASAVVIGTDNVGWLTRVLDGEVARHVAAHSHAPVVVVPEGSPVAHLKDIVLTLSEETSASGPLRFAFDIASWTGAALRVIHVVSTDRFSAESTVHRNRLEGMLRPWADAYTDVRVTPVVTVGDPADECLVAASTSDLLVVGRPRHTRRRILSEPSVVATVLRNAVCPVAVVPSRDDQ